MNQIAICLSISLFIIILGLNCIVDEQLKPQQIDNYYLRKGIFYTSQNKDEAAIFCFLKALLLLRDETKKDNEEQKKIQNLRNETIPIQLINHLGYLSTKLEGVEEDIENVKPFFQIDEIKEPIIKTTKQNVIKSFKPIVDQLGENIVDDTLESICEIRESQFNDLYGPFTAGKTQINRRKMFKYVSDLEKNFSKSNSNKKDATKNSFDPISELIFTTFYFNYGNNQVVASKIYYYLGLIYSFKPEFENIQRALMFYKFSMVQDSNHTETQYNRAILFVKSLGKSRTAVKQKIQCYEEIIASIDEKSLNRLRTLKLADLHYNLGTLYDSIGNSDNALKCYQKVISLNDKDHQAYNNIGSIFERKQKNQESIDNYRLAIRNVLWEILVFLESKPEEFNRFYFFIRPDISKYRFSISTEKDSDKKKWIEMFERYLYLSTVIKERKENRELLLVLPDLIDQFRFTPDEIIVNYKFKSDENKKAFIKKFKTLLNYEKRLDLLIRLLKSKGINFPFTAKETLEEEIKYVRIELQKTQESYSDELNKLEKEIKENRKIKDFLRDYLVRIKELNERVVWDLEWKKLEKKKKDLLEQIEDKDKEIAELNKKINEKRVSTKKIEDYQKSISNIEKEKESLYSNLDIIHNYIQMLPLYIEDLKAQENILRKDILTFAKIYE